MTGEDVYDVGRYAWCELCEAEHEPCEESAVDLRMTCLACMAPIDDEADEVDHFGIIYHAACLASRRRPEGDTCIDVGGQVVSPPKSQDQAPR